MEKKLKDSILRKVDKGAVFFFGVMVFFLPISGAAIETSFGFIFFCFILKFIIERPSGREIKEFFGDKFNLSLLVFYLCLGVSLLNSGPLLEKSLRVWVAKWGEGVVLFYLARIFLNRQRVKVLIGIFLVSAFLVCIDGLCQWVKGVDFLRGFELKGTDAFLAVTASFSHFNNFSTFLVVSFLLSFSYLFQTRLLWQRAVLYLLSFLIVINLFFTYSRAGWLSLFAGLMFFAVLAPGRKIKIFFTFFLAFLLLVAVSLPFIRTTLLGLVARGDAARLGIWKGALLMFGDFPLIGRGLGLFMDHIPDYGLEPLYAHNCYLQILAETGILGLLSFLWFLGVVWTKSIRKIISGFDPLFLGLFSALAAFLIQISFDTQLYSLKLSILFWLLVSFVSVNILGADTQKQ